MYNFHVLALIATMSPMLPHSSHGVQQSGAQENKVQECRVPTFHGLAPAPADEARSSTRIVVTIAESGFSLNGRQMTKYQLERQLELVYDPRRTPRVLIVRGALDRHPDHVTWLLTLGRRLNVSVYDGRVHCTSIRT